MSFNITLKMNHVDPLYLGLSNLSGVVSAPLNMYPEWPLPMDIARTFILVRKVCRRQDMIRDAVAHGVLNPTPLGTSGIEWNLSHG